MNKLLSLISVVSILGSTVLVSNLSKHATVIHSLKKEQWFPFANIAQGIAETENISDVVIAPNGDVYAWSENNLFKTTDGNHFINLFSEKITSVGVNGQDTYVGTSNGLLKSHNGGAFAAVSDVFTNKHIFKIVVSAKGMVYVATNFGLYQTIDGKNFFCISEHVVTNLAISLKNKIYIIHDNCLDVSADGLQWKNVYQDENYNLSNLTIGPSGEVCLVIAAPINNYLAVISSFSTISKIMPNVGLINKVQINMAETIILGNGKAIYQNLDGVNFTKYMPFVEQKIFTFALEANRRIYLSVENEGLCEINLFKNLINCQRPDYDSPAYDNTLVYNKTQYIDFRGIYLGWAIKDGKSHGFPSTNIPLHAGKHKITLFVDDDHKEFVSIFGGDVNSGAITYNFEIKENIDASIVNYQTTFDSTSLERGLISDSGNTMGSEVIQTSIGHEEGDFQAEMIININDRNTDLIDYPNSYYISGTVNEATNDFTSFGFKHKITNNFTIKADGIYQLHLVDAVGNVFNSYLEIGAKNNNKIRGHIVDKELSDLAKKLNVTIAVGNPNEKLVILEWLRKYKLAADKAFKQSLQHYGKGFDYTIDDLPNGYLTFLDNVTYKNSNTPQAINLAKLQKALVDLSNNQLKNELTKLKFKTLNIDSRNVVDAKSLNKFTTWVNNYRSYLNDNKNTLFNKITWVATRGFANETQLEDTKNYLLYMEKFNVNYLRHILWNTDMVSSDSYYLSLVKTSELQNDVFNLVKKNFPELNKLFDDYLANSIKKVNMHGYKLSQILENSSLPQTKDEIDNYMYNESFSEWLQYEASAKFSKWQWTMGLSIGIPLFIIVGAPPLYFFWSYTQRYNPRDYRIYKRLVKIDEQRFKTKKKKKKKLFLSKK